MSHADFYTPIWGLNRINKIIMKFQKIISLQEVLRQKPVVPSFIIGNIVFSIIFSTAFPNLGILSPIYLSLHSLLLTLFLGFSRRTFLFKDAFSDDEVVKYFIIILILNLIVFILENVLRISILDYLPNYGAKFIASLIKYETPVSIFVLIFLLACVW